MEESDTRIALARAYLSLRFHNRAAQVLDVAVVLTQGKDRSRQAAAMELLSQAYLAGGRPDAALETLHNARQLASEAGDQIRVASIVHSLGAVQSALKQDQEALASYAEARRLAASSHAETLAATSTINGGKTAVQLGAWQEARKLFDEALIQVHRISDSHDKAYDLIAIGLGVESLRTGIPLSQLYGVATFYAQFHLTRRGRHLTRICDGTACHVRGAAKTVQAIENAFDLLPGSTSTDYKFTLEIVYCVGSCGLAPVAVVNDKVFGQTRPEPLVRKLKKLE